ncbi:fimbrial protein [Moellerella wisconsensis]|uniref:fimbrial protein n=1 Tax=Moellerella wisconsensis TaxID=158849 RepID=UPI0030767C0B
MKKLPISLFFIMLFFSPKYLFADSSMLKGDVNFRGSIVSLPCKISLSSLDQNIDLGPISLNFFQQIGDRSPAKKIRLKFDDCVFPSYLRNDREPVVRLMFIAEPTKSTDPNLFGGQSLLNGFGIRLLDEKGHEIPNGEFRNYPVKFDHNQQIILYSMLESYLPKNELILGNIRSQIRLNIDYL